jgi:hypothetical protein
MPRLSDDSAPPPIFHVLLIGDPKTGKTDWSAKAAEAGFNVLYLNGDVALPTLSKLKPEAKERLYYIDVHGDMIQIVADLLTGKYLWNDTQTKRYNSVKDAKTEDGMAADEIWEFRPTLLDHNWVMVIDSWTTLSYSAMEAKAGEMGVDLGDIEKVERSIYSGVGNRLTQILNIIEKMPCHVIVIGHPKQMEKTKAPEGKTQKEIREIDRTVEWTKMIPQSSSNPHGLSMGKFFTDIGWMEINAGNKRKLNFKSLHDRVSGGHFDAIGDPREEHSFVSLVKSIGGVIPDGTQGQGDALIIHPPGTYTPTTPGAKVPLQAPESPKMAVTPQAAAPKGLGALLAKQPSA